MNNPGNVKPFNSFISHSPIIAQYRPYNDIIGTKSQSLSLYCRNADHNSDNNPLTDSSPKKYDFLSENHIGTALSTSLLLLSSVILTKKSVSAAQPQDSNDNIIIPRRERLYDTRRGSYLPSHPEKYILKSMKDRTVLVMGEVHSNSFDHLLEFRLLSTLTGFYGPKHIAVGLECFYRQHQKALDNFIFDHGNMGVLKQETNWKDTWGYDLSQYAKIFNYAYKNQIRLIGLNIPLQVVDYVASYGLNDIPTSLKTLLPAVDLGNTRHRERFSGAMLMSGAHGNVLRTNDAFFERLYEAQSLWDEYMAESAANFIIGNPNTKLMVIAGTGHVTGRVGIPDRIAKRVEGTVPFVVVPYDVPWNEDGSPVIDIPPTSEECDWAWYHPDPEV